MTDLQIPRLSPPLSRTCISLGIGSMGTLLEQIETHDFVEIRLDHLVASVALDKGLKRARTFRQLFDHDTPSIATCRQIAGLPDAERLRILKDAIRHGACLCDLDMSTDTAIRAQLREFSQAAGCGLILSNHDLTGTPGSRSLESMVRRGFEQGADIVKIACVANTDQEARRLLDMLAVDEWQGRLVFATLGQLGAFVRAFAVLRGAPFTYAAPDFGPKVFEAQPRARDLERAVETLAPLAKRMFL